jgi:prophage antirepressor-like protein
MENPLKEIDWSQVRSLNVDSKELCIKLNLDNGQMHRLVFRSKRELDETFREWVKQSGTLS